MDGVANSVVSASTGRVGIASPNWHLIHPVSMRVIRYIATEDALGCFAVSALRWLDSQVLWHRNLRAMCGVLGYILARGFRATFPYEFVGRGVRTKRLSSVRRDSVLHVSYLRHRLIGLVLAGFRRTPQRIYES